MKRHHASWLSALIIATIPTIFCATSAAEPYDIGTMQRTIYVSLLLDGNQRDSRFGATAIRRFGSSDIALMDMVAEQLTRIIEGSSVDPHVLQTVRTYVDTLACDSGRYRTLLHNTRSKVKESSVIRHINQALTANTKSPGPEFIAGTINTDEQRTLAMHVLTQDIRKDRSQFRSIVVGTLLEDVVSKLGMPDSIHARGMHVQLLELSYKDSGLIIMSAAAASKTWSVTSTVDEQIPVSSFYTGNNFVVAQNLGSLEGRALAYYFKSENKRIYRDASAMCLLARRIAPRTAGHYDPYEENLAEKALAHLTASSDACADDALTTATRSPNQKLAALATKLLVKRQILASGNRLKNLAGNTASKVNEPDEEDESMEGDDTLPEKD